MKFNGVPPYREPRNYVARILSLTHGSLIPHPGSLIPDP